MKAVVAFEEMFLQSGNHVVSALAHGFWPRFAELTFSDNDQDVCRHGWNVIRLAVRFPTFRKAAQLSSKPFCSFLQFVQTAVSNPSVSVRIAAVDALEALFSNDADVCAFVVHEHAATIDFLLTLSEYQQSFSLATSAQRCLVPLLLVPGCQTAFQQHGFLTVMERVRKAAAKSPAPLAAIAMYVRSEKGAKEFVSQKLVGGLVADTLLLREKVAAVEHTASILVSVTLLVEGKKAVEDVVSAQAFLQLMAFLTSPEQEPVVMKYAANLVCNLSELPALRTRLRSVPDLESNLRQAGASEALAALHWDP
jgi:hypothetical protein